MSSWGRRYYPRYNAAYGTLKGLKMYDRYKRGQRRRRYASYIAKKWPKQNYARIFIPRGTQDSLRLYGETWDAATPEQKAMRKSVGFFGRGRYGVRKFVRDINHLVPKKVGRALTNAAVQGIAMAPAMMAAGSGLYSGRGEYDDFEGSGLYSGRGSYNSLISGGRMAPLSTGHNDETGGVTISHCEYLQDVYGPASTAFAVQGFSLNPGLMDNFPWLSQFAANYEEYEFIQLIYHFRSTVDASAVNNTNGSTGTIIMATNYNPSAPLFNNKESMMQYHGSQSGRVVEDHDHGVECDPSKNAGSAQKLIRVTPVIQNQDIKSYDLGVFQLGVVNCPSAFSNQQIGELWVSYTVRLDKPRLFTALGGTIVTNKYLSTPGDTTATITRWLGGNAQSDNKLSMQQNAIPLYVTNFDGSIGATPATGIYFLWPDFITGVFEIKISIESTGVTAPATFPSANLVMQGNVNGWRDILACANTNVYSATSITPTSVSGLTLQNGINNGSTTSPGCLWYQQSVIGTGGSIQSIMLIARVSVKPVTAGIDNVCVVSIPSLSGGTFVQCGVEVTQINGNLAVSETTIPSGSAGSGFPNQLPVYVNSSSVPVVIPTA